MDDQTADPPVIDPDDQMVAVPRWILDVLSEELAMRSDCGGINDTPGCVRCDAIFIASKASETGVAPPRRSSCEEESMASDQTSNDLPVPSDDELIAMQARGELPPDKELARDESLHRHKRDELFRYQAALTVIATLPIPEQDNMLSANMRQIAKEALHVTGA